MDNQQEQGPGIDTMADHESYEMSFVSIKPGDYLEGKIVKLDSDGAFVDIGYKTEGFIPLDQLSHRKFGSPSDVVSVGETVLVVVLKVDDDQEQVLLSRKRAALEKAWRDVTKAYEEGCVIAATVIESVKGGLLVDLGLRGFVPASQVDVRPVRDLESFVGESLNLKVIELDKDRRKVVLSRKKVLEEEKVRSKEDTLNSLEEGMIIRGSVARVTDFGVFVNLGGVDGLVHISELSWKRIKHPSDVVKIGQEIEVMVLKVDKKRERISLSLRQATVDPWLTIEETIQPGQIIEGIVTKIAKNNVFVEVIPGVEGVIPLQELADKKLVKPQDILKEGETIQIKVMELIPDSRRLRLSLRQARETADKEDIPRETANPQGGGATIGDIIRAKARERSNNG